MEKTVIGIIGPIGSGKDVAAEYVANRLHVPVLQISQPLKEIARDRGIEQTRENLIQLGREIAEDKGDDYLAKILLARTGKIGVISGMRQLAQINFLRQCSRLILIGIEAEEIIRFERSKKRGKAGEADSWAEFIENEQQENSGVGPQRLFECLKLADYSIRNENSVEDLYKELDHILDEEKCDLPK